MNALGDVQGPQRDLQMVAQQGWREPTEVAVHGLKGKWPQSPCTMHGSFKCVLIWECQLSLGVKRGHACWNLVALVELLCGVPWSLQWLPSEHLWSQWSIWACMCPQAHTPSCLGPLSSLRSMTWVASEGVYPSRGLLVGWEIPNFMGSTAITMATRSKAGTWWRWGDHLSGPCVAYFSVHTVESTAGRG